MRNPAVPSDLPFHRFPEAEITTLTAERDSLKAEVARMREALGLAQSEAERANAHIVANKGRGGWEACRVKVGTALHRIERDARAALNPEKTK